MRVCFITDSYPPNLGGAELAIQRIAMGISTLGIETEVVTSVPDVSTRIRENEDRLVVRRIRLPRVMKRFWFGLLCLPEALQAARRSELVFGTTYGGAFPALIVARIARKPCVLIVHEFIGDLWFRLEPSWFRAVFYYTAERLLAALPYHRFVAVSEYSRATLLRMKAPLQKIAVILHGVDHVDRGESRPDSKLVRARFGLHPNHFVYLGYGRTGVTKGFEFLVEAIPHVIREVPNAHFLLILSRYDRRVWKRIMKMLALISSSSYQLLEPVDRGDLEELLGAVDCVVVPSLTEGFGFTAAEACAMGTRVVATTAGALPEVISGEHVFVAPGSARALAEGCIKAYRNEVDFASPKKLQWEVTSKEYHRLSEEVIKLAKAS